jgi:cyclophilin family peptidyl-prolyl cis-trans isomerase
MKKTFFLVLFVLFAMSVNLFAAKNPIVRMQTSEGDIILELYPDKAPITCKNFLAYVDNGYYDGTIFHRVIKGFMVQGGGFESGLREKVTKNGPIMNEATNGLKNDVGTIAMARTSEINSATAQFFINTVNNDFLNHKSPLAQEYGYAVFGKVIKGLDVVRKIESVKTTQVGYFSDVPVKEVVILTVSVLRKNPDKK